MGRYYTQNLMKYLDLTFPSPEENLACDETLLELCEEDSGEEILRFWEPSDYFIVLGYSGKVREEINLPACEKEKVKILRRPSGGGTVLQGHGCLNFGLILKVDTSKSLKNITQTNQYVLSRNQSALAPFLDSKIEIQGLSDLACGTFKFSGNAQRRKRGWILFQGTFLLDFDVSQMERFLTNPLKQPAYRKGRSHTDFLKNLNLPSRIVKDALRASWKANEVLGTIPNQKISELAKTRYADRAWNFKF